ncbi:hypothetical protein E4T39_05844 [Aureobasidium subglaciale]|nr:hypothetical protein E4T39_05844 [Aureobasidium subglaciale]
MATKEMDFSKSNLATIGRSSRFFDFSLSGSSVPRHNKTELFYASSLFAVFLPLPRQHKTAKVVQYFFLGGLVLHPRPEFKSSTSSSVASRFSSTSMSGLLKLGSASASSSISLTWLFIRDTTGTTLHLSSAWTIATRSLASSSACTSACVPASQNLTGSLTCSAPSSSSGTTSCTASSCAASLEISNSSFNLLGLFLLNNLLIPDLDLPIEEFDPDVPECEHAADCEEHGEEDCHVCFHFCGYCFKG